MTSGWRVATIAGIWEETVAARTLVLDVPGWPGHLAGQHVDVKLTSADGYSAQRSYSIASAPPTSTATGQISEETRNPDHGVGSSTVEITVQRMPHGELSTWLCDIAMVGDQFEIKGPVGGYFVWEPSRTEPVLLVAGGSGIVPLMAMCRARAAAGSRVPFRLIYSTRDPDTVIYGAELTRRVRDDQGLDVALVYTRQTPDGWPRPPGRIDATVLVEDGWPADFQPSCYVCGPTGFVEAAADLLVAAGHDPARVRTERFGPTN